MKDKLEKLNRLITDFENYFKQIELKRDLKAICNL